MVGAQHQFVEVIAQGGTRSALCSCGWHSVPAASETHARKRWAIHASQQHAASLCASAMTVGWSARVRSAELSVLTVRARQRRATLAARRAELHRALWEAERRARPFRPKPYRTLECGRQLAGLSETDLWLQYVTTGGALTRDELVRALDGTDDLEDRDYDIISAVLNEEFRVARRRPPPSVADSRR